MKMQKDVTGKTLLEIMNYLEKHGTATPTELKNTLRKQYTSITVAIETLYTLGKINITQSKNVTIISIRK